MAPEWRLFFTPLHQAAYGNAPVEVIKKLIRMGAWRTLQNANNDRPLTLPVKKDSIDSLSCWNPNSGTTLRQIEKHFHATIRSQAHRFIERHHLRFLPQYFTGTHRAENVVSDSGYVQWLSFLAGNRQYQSPTDLR